MGLEPFERNGCCVECGKKHFREYAGKWGVELGENDPLLGYAVNSRPGNIRESGNIIFPEIWQRAGLIPRDRVLELQKTRSSGCLTSGELEGILEADPEKESRRGANERAWRIILDTMDKKRPDFRCAKEALKMSALANQMLDSYADGFQAGKIDPEALYREELLVDDSSVFLGYTKGKHVGIIPDNAGEAQFDSMLAIFLASGRRVSVVCAITPKWDDVTYQECVKIFNQGAEVIPSFSICHYSSEEMNQIADDNGIDCWLAKGMMNLEAYGPDWNRPVFNSLSLKCRSMKEYFGLNGEDGPRGVITLQPYHRGRSGIYNVRVVLNPMNSDRDIPESVTSEMLGIARGVAVESGASGYAFPVSVRPAGREFYQNPGKREGLLAKDYDVIISADGQGMKRDVEALGGRIRERLMAMYSTREPYPEGEGAAGY